MKRFSKRPRDEGSEPDQAASPDSSHTAAAGGIHSPMDILALPSTLRMVSILSRSFFQFVDRGPARRAGRHGHLCHAGLVLFHAAAILIPLVSTAKNITEQMRTEKAMRQSEERYRDLFESTSDLIQAVAPDGCLKLQIGRGVKRLDTRRRS